MYQPSQSHEFRAAVIATAVAFFWVAIVAVLVQVHRLVWPQVQGPTVITIADGEFRSCKLCSTCARLIEQQMLHERLADLFPRSPKYAERLVATRLELLDHLTFCEQCKALAPEVTITRKPWAAGESKAPGLFDESKAPGLFDDDPFGP